MRTIPDALLEALQDNSGQPAMHCLLLTYSSGVWHLLVVYPIVYAVLSRLIFDVCLQGNCFGPGLIEVPSTQPYAIIIRRGVTVGLDFLYVDSLKYHVSQCEYHPDSGQTHIVADLLPMVATAPTQADIPVHTLLETVLEAVHGESFIYNTDLDIFYNWQFYPTGKLLSLKDTRSLSTVLENKYLAYLFPREDGIQLFNISDLVAKTASPPHYTPFPDATIRTLFSSVQNVNSSWYDENGVVYYNEVSASAPWHDLGFIKTADGISDPRELPDFNNWGQFNNAIFYEITTRPDLRLEQGDVLYISADGFTRPRAFEYIEIFKHGGYPRWRQVLYEIPLMPWMYQEWFRKYMQGVMGAGASADLTQSAYNIRLVTDAFNGLLNAGNTQVQSALDALDEAVTVGAVLPATGRPGQVFFNTSSRQINLFSGSDWYQAAMTRAAYDLLLESADHVLLESGSILQLEQ